MDVNDVAAPFHHPLFGHLVATLAPYDPGTRLSLTLFENFCRMNGILNEPVNEAGEYFPILNLKRMLFIQYIGHRAYEEIRRASLPQNPAEKSINFMVGVVRQAFEPQGLVEANRMRFATLVQRDGQSAQSFVNALQVAADACDFGTAYSMTLKSRLLAGIRDDRIRETLLSQSLNQDYEATKTLFLQLDANRLQSEALARAANVHKVQPQRGPRGRGNQRGPRRSTFNPTSTPGRQGANRHGPARQGGPATAAAECWRCGRAHDPSTCAARNWTCFTCNKPGHAARKCSKRVHHAQHQDAAAAPRDGDVDSEVDQVFSATMHSVSANSSRNLSRADLNLNAASEFFSDDIVIGYTSPS